MMTTLQIVLAIVGISLIAVIVIYNVLQERKFRKEADRMFTQRRDDIMLGESVRTEASLRRAENTHIQLSEADAHAPEARQAVSEAEAPLEFPHLRRPEPAFEAEPEPIPEPEPRPPSPESARGLDISLEPPGGGEVILPVLGARQAPPSSTPPAPPHPLLAEEEESAPAQVSGLDEATEYVARLKFANPKLANFGPLLGVLRRIGKPMRAYGRRPDGGWEALSGHPRNVYAQVEFGLQLADRGGALSQDQLDAFCRALYEFAAEEGGAVSCPDKEAALRQGRDLDLFCMDVDVLIGLNVVSADSRPFTSEAMHSLAMDSRLSLEGDGTFHAKDDFGHTLFTLANQEEAPFPRDGRGLTTHGVTLLFDVPRVADGLAVFDRMTRLGMDLAWRLEGRLVDDNGRVVNEDSLNRDRARLAQYFARMESRGIPAGGERALRLFV